MSPNTIPFFSFLLLLISLATTATKLSVPLIQIQQLLQQPTILKYHHGSLLKGNITVNLIWYGKFTSSQRTIIVDFINSLSSSAVKSSSSSPSVSSWWKTTEKYRRGGSNDVVVGKQIFDKSYSLGKSLKTKQLRALTLTSNAQVNVVLTSADVGVDGFCTSRCGTHGSGRVKRDRFVYGWVGNSLRQCPGYCAWPFHKPVYGPQTPPLIAPNGDVGVDGMVINLATILAGAVTNPFNNGYFQGPAEAPLEAVSACTGIFGKGAYPGYPGKVLVGKNTGASYNAIGVNGRKYLLPAMWDPKTSTCKTLV